MITTASNFVLAQYFETEKCYLPHILLTIISTGGCGKRGGDRRLRFLLTDSLSNDSVRFYVTCFGRYAEELEEAGLLENETLKIWKPHITLKRWQPGEKRENLICDYELVSLKYQLILASLKNFDPHHC